MACECEKAEDFKTFLTSKLTDLNKDADTETFVEYISGILADEVNTDEWFELLIGIVEQICADKAEETTKDIIEKWTIYNRSTLNASASAASNEQDNVADRLEQLLEENRRKALEEMKHSKPKSKADAALKEAILKQYAEISDGEKTDDSENESVDQLHENVNSKLVLEHEKQLRESNKAAADQKKTKDKEDREKQKQKNQDRKEAEQKRTQKSEKRA